MLALLAPLAYLPHFLSYHLGKWLGRCVYHFHTSWRKRALSNLSLATKLSLTHEEIVQIAQRSFENLGITALEYPKLLFRPDYLPAKCLNPELAEQLHQDEKGLIFFCGHQANWELLFLEGSKRMAGTAIGRPIKQKKLYRAIVAMREKYGGKIIAPKEALKEGLRALREGRFLGIVGDQGMPESPFSCDFLGRRAFTTTAPALLSFKTGAPLIVATIRRKGPSYEIHYSDPLHPSDWESPEEMMRYTLELFERSVLENPHEWLWIHNRWKQESPKNVFYRFRHDAILILVKRYEPFLEIFRQIYPKAFITIWSEEPFESPHFDVIHKRSPQEFFERDYSFKLVFNFTVHPVKRHFKRLSAFDVLDMKKLKSIATRNSPNAALETREEILIKALCRRGSLWS